ncbi:flavin-containing monooxygenase [Aspergillus mulundensis]|uniref:L-ornithine N(5)-oxygenase n=1 Tax=Aspergillus mulundensis TaxID=1810919 RepID=A0A3D8SCN4_9EURO|nr:Uncharacterized protein DSM5745_04412 [Aspergillus mulundensis]RDW84086.1 Uncharacterized protein DSM5745_04412 [Aspergillus mulundensis]
MACRLTRDFQLNDYAIYDRQPGMGGTWWANTYPGCAVDIPGFCYSYSFAPNPDFTQMFPPQAEILSYLSTVARKYRVDEHFTGNTEWIGAEWREKSGSWVVTLRDLGTMTVFRQECRVLISAVGGLVDPAIPRIPGLEGFKGEVVHTAGWREGIELKGRRVAVIGNGASAAQLVPAIVDEAASVTQFMRSPHHIVSANNHQVPPAYRAVLRHFPMLLYLIRLILFLYMEITWFRFQNNRLGKIGRASVEKRSQQYVQHSAPESYWDLLIPKYEFGCRRRIFDRGYLSALHSPKVHLTTDRISSITPTSILTTSGTNIPIDVILLATGFNLTHYDTPITGRHGLTRKQAWEEVGHKATYKSIAMHDFPNFFYILGPNSGRVYTSTIMIIESQVEMVLNAIKPILLGQAASVEVRADREAEYDVKLHKAIGETVHSSECGSYFIDKGTEKNWFVYPWNSVQLWFSTYFGNKGDWVYRDGHGRFDIRSSICFEDKVVESV